MANSHLDLAMTFWILVDSNTGECRLPTGDRPLAELRSPAGPYINPATATRQSVPLRHHKRVLPCCSSLAAWVAKEIGVSWEVVRLRSPANTLQPALQLASLKTVILAVRAKLEETAMQPRPSVEEEAKIEQNGGNLLMGWEKAQRISKYDRWYGRLQVIAL